MKTLSYPAAALIVAALVAPAAAQLPGFGHANASGAPPSGAAAITRSLGRAINPSLSLSAPANSPLQAQMQDDYATQLRQSQSDLLQQNPSGSTRSELAIGHELNGFTAPR